MKTFKIPSYYPAPERSLVVLNINKFIQAYNSYLPKSFESSFDSVFKEWFDNECRNNNVSQGEEFFSKTTSIDIEFGDNSTESYEIPVEGKLYDQTKLEIVKSMKDYDILIEGNMEWSSGTWNTFTLNLDDGNEFDPKKIKAVGELGLIVDYTYDGKYLFNSEDDWELNDGYISVHSSIFYNGSLHKIDLENLKSNLDSNDISLDPEIMLNFIIEELEKKEKMNNFNPEVVSDTGKHWTSIYEEALLLYPNNMRMAAKHLGIKYETFKEGCTYYPFLYELWKSD